MSYFLHTVGLSVGYVELVYGYWCCHSAITVRVMNENPQQLSLLVVYVCSRQWLTLLVSLHFLNYLCVLTRTFYFFSEVLPFFL